MMPVFRQFGAQGEPVILYGGSQPIYRVGDLVFKRIREETLENDHSPQLSEWISSFTVDLPQVGFRLPQPVRTLDGLWITSDGWTAMKVIEGQRAQEKDLPACIDALNAFHHAIRHIPRHPLMDHNQTAWGKAHRWCWGDPPPTVQAELRPLVERLIELRRPVSGLKYQLIHGDANPDNFLVGEGLLPGVIDFSPFWGPPEFSLAILANFAGPRRGSTAPLAYFRRVNQFNQLLIRAALRMLWVVSVFNGLDDWTSEKLAAELVIDFVRGSSDGEDNDAGI